MANTYKAFKGILQYKSTDTFTKQAGYIYFVREFKDGKETNNAEVWFGTRKYGDINATGLAELQRQITANAENITAINDILGEWSAKFQGDISTVASAVVAVSGATTTNASAIAKLNGDAGTEGSVAKAVADAKSELVDNASEGYDTLGGLETKIKAVAQSVTDKNVSAEGDGTYITASANENKVTVTATKKTTDAIALAETAVQKIATGSANGTISVDGSDVAVKGLGSAAYTESSAYDASGTAATVKTELLGTTKDGDATTIAALNTKIEGVAAAAKTYSVVAVTGDELTALGANVKDAYKLVDEDSVKSGEYIKIYKDSALKKVELDGQELVFTYLLATGAEDIVRVDVSNFLAESEFKDGLQVVDGEVSVKKNASSEKFLSVSADGIKLSGVQDAIDAGVNSANSYTDIARNTLDAAITGLTETFTGYTGTTNTTLTKLRTDVDAVSGTASNNATAITQLNTDKLDKTTYETDKASTDSVLAGIRKDLNTITLNAVTSIASTGKTITVVDDKGAVNVEVNTLAHAESGQDGYVIFNKTNDGALYGVMYYGGDDAE